MTKKSALWKTQAFLFFTSQCITLFGSQVVQMAIVWYVTRETGSGAWVAASSLCAYLPQFFMSFWGGVWADRYSKKALIICADALIALITLIVFLVLPRIGSGAPLLITLLLMSALRSLGAGIQTPAVNAVIPQLVPEVHRMRYNGINAAMQSLVQFAAPAASAIILTTCSLRTALLIDVITAALGIALLFCLALPRQSGTQENAVHQGICAGIRYACSHAAVRKPLIIYGLFLFLSVPAGYLAGLFVSRMFGNAYWHLTAVELIGFGGMTLGGLIMSLWGGFNQRKTTLSASLALFGVMAIAMGMSRHFTLYLFFMTLYGVALTVVQTTITTILQEHTKAAMQGRVFGLMSALYASCYPMGMAVFGPLADKVSLSLIMILSGGALLLLASAAHYEKHQT